MKSTLFHLLVILLAGCAVLHNGKSDLSSVWDRPILTDGSFDDWEGVEKATDDFGDVPGTGLDLGSVSIKHDSDFLHLMLEFDRQVNVQRLDGSLKILLDVDGTSETGMKRNGMPGVDLVVQFSPENTEDPTLPGSGVAVASTTYSPKASDESARITHADLGFILAPTYATERIECRIDRTASLPDTAPLFQGASFALKLVLLDHDGTTTDDTDVISHSLTPSAFDGIGASDVDPFPSRVSGALRVVTWNVRFGAIIKEPDAPGRILAALDPDIVLLQEMTEDDSAAELESVLNSRVSNGAASWRVLFGEGGGPLRCAIASRLPLEPLASIALLPYPNRSDWSLRTIGGVVTMGDRRILVTSLHLKCCGRIDSSEDDTRLMEAGLINRAIKAALATERFDAVVLGGDFNLVGRYAPIEVLQTGLDVDNSNLAILEPYQLDGRCTTTWSDHALPFVPGRLDYLLVSDSSIEEVQSFVFDSAIVPGRLLSHYSLAPPDSATASDHFPIVADLTWRD